jgi:CRISPR-associated protein Cas6
MTNCYLCAAPNAEKKQYEKIEFRFSIQGSLIPRNYHYCLYAALTTLAPILKENSDWMISRISNTTVFDDRNIKLADSILKLRCSKDLITSLAMLFEESTLMLGENAIAKLKFIQGLEITSKEDLSGTVTIKTEHNREPDPMRFAVCLGKQLAKLNIDTLPIIGRKEQLIIKKQPCAVYPVLFKSLRPEESLVLQTQGIGGRKHLGCGFFE